MGPPVITHIRGILRAVTEEELTLAVEPMEFAVLVPEHRADNSRDTWASRSRCTPSSILKGARWGRG